MNALPKRGEPPAKALRCAIYTRKSTEHGLEQEFNSLDNQREAAEAFVKSQAHEGWRLNPDAYDDGGFSGGTLERPALKRLLAEIEAGRVNVVVVYKVDRLTRSLADFAKLIELFDRHGASFVSVTQAFNTTSSMGRLTLNVLLSFAQFEREVTGERNRYNIAASKRKGMRVGGPVPLGYVVRDKKLVPCPVEAEQVRSIFAGYLAAGSLMQLMRDLDARGLFTKVNLRRDGTVRGGIRFGKGGLAALLKNRCYIGEVIHKGRHYPGEHQGIVDPPLFDAVGAALAAGAPAEGLALTGALLKGLLFDDRGNRMTPSSAKKNGARYRYYVSACFAQGRREAAGGRSRVSAPDLEAVVLKALQGAPSSHASDAVGPSQEILQRVERIVLKEASVEISLRMSDDDAALNSIVVPFAAVHRPRRGIVGVPEAIEARPIRAETRARLVQNIANARLWLAELGSGRMPDTRSIALRDGYSERHVRETLNLAFLAPDIVKAAVEGSLADGVGVVRLSEVGSDWNQQREALSPRHGLRRSA